MPSSPPPAPLADPLEPQAAVARLIRRTRFVSAAAAVVLSPIPFADEVFLVPVYGALALRIAKQHGVTARRIPWGPVVGTAITALAARAALGAPVAYIPGVAAVTNAFSAATVTELVGRFIDRACREPGSTPRLTFREVGAALRAKLQRKVSP